MLLNNKGQLDVARVAIATVVVFVVLAIGMALVSNIQGSNTADPNYINVPFNDLWPLAVAGVAILAVVISIMALIPRAR